MLLFINIRNIFILIPLNISNIEPKEDLDTDELKNFNINVQIHLTFEKEYKEFIVIRVNLNTIKKDGEKHLYNKDDLYLESNNIRYNGII